MNSPTSEGKALSKRQIFVVRAVTILLTLAFCFGAFELVISKYYLDQQSGSMSTFHPQRGWALIPGEYRVKPLGKFTSFPIFIDEFGFRTSDPAVDRQSTTKVVVLGDSFVFARETNIEEMFTQRLETLLSERVPSGVEVLNAGVPSYGTGQQLLFVKELQERQVQADIYVLMFFTNDILDNLCLSYGDLKPQPVRPCFALDQAGNATLARLPENQPDYEDDTLAASRQTGWTSKTVALAKGWAEEWIQTKPELIRLLDRVGIRPRVSRIPGLLNAWYRDKVVAEGVPLTASLIQQLQREIREKGGELVVSMVPSSFQVYPETYVPLLKKSFPGDSVVDRFAEDMLRPQRLVKEMCLKAGVPFQDLLPTFIENQETALFIPRDGHLTRAGHKLVGETLLPFVLSNMPKNAAEDVSHVFSSR